MTRNFAHRLMPMLPSGVALLLMACLMLASQSAWAQSNQFQFAPDSYFINVILKGILGDVINPSAASAGSVVTGNGTLGEVFRTFNLGVAFFGSVIVVFITLVGVLQSGNDGEFLGRKWSSMWVPVRFAAGSVLMLPLTSSGYSYCQAIVLWIASQGIGFADTLWSTIATRIGMKDGMELTQQMDLTSVTKAVALAEICAAGLNTLQSNAMGASAPEPIRLIATDVSKEGVRTMRFVWTRPSAVTSTQEDSSCGSISYSVNGTLNRLSDPYVQVREAVAGAHANQIRALSNKYRPMAEGIVSAYLSSSEAGSDPTPRLTAIATEIDGDARQYNQLMANVVTQALNASGYKIRNAPGSTDMTRYGFAMAGMWYIELLKAHNTARHSLSTPSLAGANLTSISSEPSANNFGLIYQSASNLIKTHMTNMGSGNTSASASGNAGGNATIRTTTTNFSIDTDMLLKAGFVDGILVNVMNYVREAVFGVGQFSNGNANNVTQTSNSIWGMQGASQRDPNVSTVLQLKDKGDTILNMAGVLMTLDVTSAVINGTSEAANRGLIGKALDTAATVATGGGTFFGQVGAAIVGKLSAYMLGAITSLFILGITLSVFIPMIPYVLWVGALLGLCVLIIEALVAIMLWAVMMMHPSGDGITSDYNRQGLNMLLAVFMRPSLLLMGLVLGMFMVEPMVMFVNDTFSIVMASVQSNTLTGVFTGIAFIAIYVSLILMIVEKSFGLIHVVPDRVLTWIGGPGALTGEEQSSVAKGQAMMDGASKTAGGIMLGRGLSSKRTAGSAPGMAAPGQRPSGPGNRPDGSPAGADDSRRARSLGGGGGTPPAASGPATR